MGMPAARLTDMHVCPMVTVLVPHVGGPISGPCAVTVLIGGLPAARVTDMAVCAGPPDVIVLDLLLPEQNGFAVLEQLRGRCSAPVLVLTARTELDDRLKSFALGAADFVAKPFFLEELVARIKSRLRAREEAPRRMVTWGDVALDLDAPGIRVTLGAEGLLPTLLA